MKKIKFLDSLLILFSIIIYIKAQDSLYLVNSIVGDTQNRLWNAKAAGDLNGDGYADLAVMFQDSTHIYLGNPAFELKTDVVIPQVLSFPGDVNNDGFADFIYIKNKSGLRAIYLGFGGNELYTSGILLHEQQYWDEVFSDQVDPLGDVNKDGYNDFIISSPYNWSNGISYVYLFLGGDSIDNEPVVTFMHSPWIDENSEATFGTAVTGIGDYNQDGYDDFLISDPGYVDTIGAQSSGRVYLYYGGSALDSIADSILTFSGKEFGFNLKNVGDINNDGTMDFAITSYDSCIIYFNFDNSFTTRFYGSGHGIGGNGDIDNDEISDFILGYIKGDENDYSGMECYTGSPEIDLTPDYYANEEQEYSSFAKYSDFIGDFNRDGYDDIFVVASSFRSADTVIGKCYIYSSQKISGLNYPSNINDNKYYLYSNYPNPFNNTTTIQYDLPEDVKVVLEVYDIQGQKVKTLVNGFKEAGYYEVIFDGSHLASGLYIYKIKAADFSSSKRMLLIK